MSYYLLDHPNPNGNHFYDSRRGNIDLVVVHTAENLPDYDGEDSGAERVARYFATTSRSVSAHATSDSDSIVELLPDDFTAWHVRGYNSRSLGLEIATQAHRWGSGPEEWEQAALQQAAKVVAKWCERWNVPIDRISKSDADGGKRGIVSHSALDPTRRSDPGIGFPWKEFMSLVETGGKVKPKPPKISRPKKKKTKDDVLSRLELLKRGSRGAQVKVVQDLLSLYGSPVNIDGIFGPETERGVREVQRREGAAVDGIVGPETWGKILAVD